MVIDFLAVREPIEKLVHFVLLIGWCENSDGLSDSFGGGIAIHSLSARVPADNCAVQGFAIMASTEESTMAASCDSLSSTLFPLRNVSADRKHIRLSAKCKLHRGNGGVTVFAGFGSESELHLTDLTIAPQILENF